MKNLRIISFFFITGFFFYPDDFYAQNNKIKVSEDPQFQRLLNEKRKINSSITINDRYKIQIYNGDNENAKRFLNEIKRDYKNTDATIIFNTPNYKVVVGNYKTKIEAERALKEFHKKYSSAIIIKPNR